MDLVQLVLADFDASVLKEPRGFMKILQFVFTICAFATTTSFFQYIKIQVMCPNGNPEVATIPLSYSFKLYQSSRPVCSGSLDFRQDFSSDSEFFVAIFVIAFLCTIAVLCFYTLFNKMYEEDARYPTADFFLHCIFGILMLACSSAWANSLNGLKSATDIGTIAADNPDLCKASCKYDQEPNFSKLNISIIFGFLNTFLFISNIWFIYKETVFFTGKPNQEQPATGAPQTVP